MTTVHSVGVPQTGNRFGELAAQLTGTVVTSGEPSWNIARRAWNLAIDQTPAAVVFAESPADVAATVRFAATRDLRVAAQGTGHLAAALPDLSETILLKTERLQSISIDRTARSVRIGAGLTWGTLTERLREQGLSGLYGTSDGVGVVGYTIGGGIGWLARTYGIACSYIRSAEIVDGTGEARSVDAQLDPDLLWALRGGGGGYGVVTSLTFDVQPAAEVYAGSLWYPLERAAEVLDAYHTWTADLPNEATTAVRLMRIPDAPFAPEPLRGKAFTILQGSILGAEPAQLLAPMRALRPGTDTFRTTTTDAISAVHLAPSDPSPTAGDGFVLDDLPAAARAVVVEQLGAGAETSLAVVEFRHLGGKLAQPDSGGGALTHLAGRYLVKTGNVAPDRHAYARVLKDSAALNDSLRTWAAPRDYLNFREIPVQPGTLFDDDTCARLRDVKNRYDPGSVIVGRQTPSHGPVFQHPL